VRRVQMQRRRDRLLVGVLDELRLRHRISMRKWRVQTRGGARLRRRRRLRERLLHRRRLLQRALQRDLPIV
jgi:hypothetical protein